eukprot:TRINITY_DN1332_c0_g1_i2.p1 TRINITY_DN1332_c0_g1~~TRINITY_DN1332_c0_g1_i2.p1  ORF type:complete len:439 (-),score=60.17 TRINITY_DN1332_c0_g1_i2:266-1582(-)
MFRELYFLHAEELSLFENAHHVAAADAIVVSSPLLNERGQRLHYEFKDKQCQGVYYDDQRVHEQQDVFYRGNKSNDDDNHDEAFWVESSKGQRLHGQSLFGAVVGGERDVQDCRIPSSSGRVSGRAIPHSGLPPLGDGTVTWGQLLLGMNFQCYLWIHVCAVVTLFLSFSWKLLALCVVSYTLRMFGITGGYHRLLSHRSYKTTRVWQFIMAALGSSALQKGPLWWCSNHRHHHRTADTKEDFHSPLHYGFWWSHVGWFLLSTKNMEVRSSFVPDLLRFPELQYLDRYHYLPPLAMALLLFIVGGWPYVGWGFVVSTVLCWHATYAINSVAHLVGSRKFKCEFNTHCDARNNLWLALLTLGEGWHNNHHCYMRSARHGFYPQEVDTTYYTLLFLEWLGIIWDLEMPPFKELEGRKYDEHSYMCRCTEVDKDLAECMLR